MPQRPKRYNPGVASGVPKYTPPHLARKTAHERGYDSRWRDARLSYLAEHPLCVPCRERGLTVAAEVVDHITPHKGDQTLFWDSANWRSLCLRCHNSATAKFDGGFGRSIKRKPGSGNERRDQNETVPDLQGDVQLPDRQRQRPKALRQEMPTGESVGDAKREVSDTP